MSPTAEIAAEPNRLKPELQTGRSDGRRKLAPRRW
jgi:hypothetical protein